jgi:hypothetical protein
MWQQLMQKSQLVLYLLVVQITKLLQLHLKRVCVMRGGWVRRRWGWVVLTRYCIVRQRLDNGGFGVGESARVDHVVVLSVLTAGG